MCGKFGVNVRDGWQSEKTQPINLEDFFYLLDSLKKRTNLAPTDQIIAFEKIDNQILPSIYKWGIKFSDKSPLIFNSRIETISQKPFWRKLFDKNKCIVPMTEFYEWKKVGSRKVPYRVYLKSEDVFFVPGLMNIKDNKKCVSLITTEPNDFIKQIHHRMPVILHIKDAIDYLSDDAEQNLSKCIPCEDNENMEMEETVL